MHRPICHGGGTRLAVAAIQFSVKASTTAGDFAKQRPGKLPGRDAGAVLRKTVGDTGNAGDQNAMVVYVLVNGPGPHRLCKLRAEVYAHALGTMFPFGGTLQRNLIAVLSGSCSRPAQQKLLLQILGAEAGEFHPQDCRHVRYPIGKQVAGREVLRGKIMRTQSAVVVRETHDNHRVQLVEGAAGLVSVLPRICKTAGAIGALGNRGRMARAAYVAVFIRPAKVPAATFKAAVHIAGQSGSSPAVHVIPVSAKIEIGHRIPGDQLAVFIDVLVKEAGVDIFGHGVGKTQLCPPTCADGAFTLNPAAACGCVGAADHRCQNAQRRRQKRRGGGGPLPAQNIFHPGLRVVLHKGQGAGSGKVPSGGEGDQRQAVGLFHLRPHFPQDRLVAAHLHIPTEQKVAQPDRRIPPVDRQNPKPQQLPPVIQTAKVGPFVKQDVSEFLRLHVKGHIDFWLETAQHEGRLQPVALEDAALQKYPLPYASADAKIRDDCPDQHCGQSHGPDHRQNFHGGGA
ncbi:hypothetical protein SDC9_74381 [bioreactor metagenome]|uniref:Uncharacterized protein n=1 Tax=bioreactor metagenome TaxID=1076179 RepID=A0A644YH95_9ZZZZ